jgi:histidyl-tRNA synthetase
MIGAVSEVLQALGFTDFIVQLNHRVLLTAMLDAAGVDTARHGDALIAIDKLDKIGRDKVADDLVARGIDRVAADACLAAFENVNAFNEMVGRSEAGAAATRNITQIMTLADATAANGHVRFTPRLARGLSYYTGAIMEISVPDLAGSLGGGGRYDGLIGMFSGEQIPACGFSLGLERILVVMGERNMFPESVQGAGPDVLVTVFDDASLADALALASDLRRTGLRAELYPEPDKLGKQFKYASVRQAMFVAICGTDERARGDVTIKNMKTGEQASVSRTAVAAHLASQLAPRAPQLD